MVLMTMIARVADGLPLAASVQEEEQVCEVLAMIVILFVFMFCISLYPFSEPVVRVIITSYSRLYPTLAP